MYVNYCHECGRALSSAQTERCERCAWLRCECGACGCTYEAAGVRAVLATVPPIWGAVAPRHAASARMSGSRFRAVAPAVVFAVVAVVLALGLATLSSILAPEVAVAPDLGTAAAAAPAVPPAGAVDDSIPPADEPILSDTAPSTPLPAETDSPPPPSVEAPRSSPSLPSVLYVANTDGQGAYLRTQPRDGNDTRIVAWQEGTPMTPLESTTVAESSGPAVWLRVRDPRGQTGWLRQAYLRPTR